MRSALKYLVLCLSFSCSVFGQRLNTDLVYLVNEPAKKAAKTPVLLLLHGYGSNEEDLFELAKAVDPRFITFSLRGNFPKEQGGYCWYNLTMASDGNFIYDYKQAQESKRKIMSFISQACKAYQLDSTQVFLMGFSQGAIMSYDMAASFPEKIKGVLALSGRLMEETRQIKMEAKFTQVKFFVAHGLSDNLIKITEAEKAVAFLRERKVSDITYKTYEIPHSISGTELNDMKAWLSKALAPRATNAAANKN